MTKPLALILSTFSAMSFPSLNHGERRHEEVESGGFLERLVFPENQNHGKQAHTGGDDDEGENEGSVCVLQSGSPLDSPRVHRANRYP